MSAEWGYRKDNGPKKWVETYPVAAGSRQSPIDIKPRDAQYDSSLKPLKIEYSEGNDFNVSNSGHSLVISRQAREGVQLSGGPLADKYRFEQFHFHWGNTSAKGSEHTLDGKEFPAELHLVHWNTKYDSFGDAASKEDGLAVLGFFVQIGGEHAALKKILDETPQVQKVGAKQDLKCAFNLSSMLPSNTKDYWTYLGSLTTPPLFESVTWFVFKEPISVTEAQMEQLRSLYSKDGNKIVDNFRPPTPLKGRNVRASFM